MNRWLTTVTLLIVFGTSAFMSVFGLVSIFSVGLLIPIICMGIGLELGKILTVVHLHRNWKRLNFISRSFYIFVIAALVLITSCEVLGYLTQRHAVATNGLFSVNENIKSLENESDILKDQIKIIDDTLAGLPETYVTRRITERQAAGYEKKQARVLEIAGQITALKVRQSKSIAFDGPVYATGRLFGLNESQVITLFILLLVAILEPLSIGLTVATSMSWQKRNTEKTVNQTIKKAVIETNLKNSRNNELMRISDKYGLKADDIARITRKKKNRAVHRWLSDNAEIPESALNKIRLWTQQNTAVAIRAAPEMV